MIIPGLASASIGRFHFLEQVGALARLGVPCHHFCDDPRVLGLGPARGSWLARAAAEFRWRRRVDALDAHVRAGRALQKRLAGAGRPRINSAFALETVRARPGEVWVDHGSLDERHVRRVLAEEAADWSEPLMAQGGNHGRSWLVERQAEEFAGAAGVVVASRLAQRSLVEQGVPAGAVRVVPLGVDLARFRPAPEPEGYRPFRVLHAGPVSFNKGVHRLIEAFRIAGGASSELWIVGAFADQASENWLRRQARDLRVRFLPPVRQNRLPALFARCDLFVLASLADGFGLTVLQALACGLPAVVSRQAGCAEPLGHSPAADVIPGCVATLGEALRRWPELLAGRRDEWRQRSRAAVEGLTWAAHARRLANEMEVAEACSN